ncbi:hypothetical protein SHK09_02775 [Polaribacter sp. PL03]|uniref:hypothetical protein n=1 Tax=Polaribacter sp. PL03 TaxID=3088353 RepID=UPI0029D3BEAD|nr:hypothetical protein [Polaribacter sp. PL03]MDX6745705.1 hypothetical protein [Polaribacter sp. PL03]
MNNLSSIKLFILQRKIKTERFNLIYFLVFFITICFFPFVSNAQKIIINDVYSLNSLAASNVLVVDKAIEPEVIYKEFFALPIKEYFNAIKTEKEWSIVSEIIKVDATEIKNLLLKSESVIYVGVDTDGDGIDDIDDLDDDNDGILDTVECSDGLSFNDSFEAPIIQILGVDALNGRPDGDNDGEVDAYLSQNSIEGWTVTDANSFDIIFDLFNASKGNQSIDLYGTPNATGIQKTYSGFTEGLGVSFSVDYSSVENLFKAEVLVDYGDGPILLATLEPNNIATIASPGVVGSRASAVIWNTYTTNLLPTATGTIKIIIQSTSLGLGQSGVLIDNVALSQPSCLDSDLDSIPDYLDSDSDNDGISDVIESGGVDADNNGEADGIVGTSPTTNGVPSSAGIGQMPTTTDVDMIPDYLDLDSDNDGIYDLLEAGGTDSNNDGTVDNTSDLDNDGLADIYDNTCLTPASSASTNYVTAVTAFQHFTDISNAIGVPGSSSAKGPTGWPGSNPFFIVLDFAGTLPSGTVLTMYLGTASGSANARLRQTDSMGNGFDNYKEYSVSGTGPSTYTYTINANTDYIKIQTYDYNLLVYGVEYSIAASGGADCSGVVLVPTETTVGIPNYLNTDSDNDGCKDVKEAGYTDTNNNGEVDGSGYSNKGLVLNSNGYRGTSAAVIDSSNNFYCLDTDLDGLLDSVDLDDDNDGILDTEELCLKTRVEWMHNDPETPSNATVGTNSGNSDYATYNDRESVNNSNFTSAANISFGTLNETGSQYTYVFNNANESNFSSAKAAGNYVEVSYTPAVNLWTEQLTLGWYTGNNSPDGAYGNFDMTLEMDTDPNFGNPTIKFQDFHVDDMINNGYLSYNIPSDAFLIAGTTYYFRFYIYNNQNSTSFTRFDDVVFEHKLACDTDGDGKSNHLDLDSDNDGITDVIESGGTDANKDGKADDSNNNTDNLATNGVPTSAGTGQVAISTDLDGIPDFLDTDSDNDGCPDALEASGTIKAGDLSTLIGGSVGGSSQNLGVSSNTTGSPIVARIAATGFVQSTTTAVTDATNSNTCAVDLSVLKIIDKAFVKKGQIIIFTIQLKNSGGLDATGVQVKDLLPAGLTYNAASSIIPTNTTYTVATGIWDLSALTIVKDQTIELKIAAVITTVGSIKTNKAEVFFLNETDKDSVPNSNN